MKLIKRKTFNRSVYLIIGLTLTVSLYSLSGCQPQPSQHVYRIGLGPWVGFGPLYLAQEKGFFQEVGIKPELTVITGLAERNSALKSEKIDALAAPVDYFVLSAGNRLPTKIVMAIDESVGGDGIVAKKSIKSIQDLRGKKVAFQRGLPSEFFLRALLQRNGMTLNDLQAIDMETAQGGAAFIANRVDAAVLWEPWLTKAREQGNGAILASTKQYPNLIVDCLAFNQAVVAQHPEEVQKIVNVVLKAIDYWEKNPEEANKIMAPFFQVDAAKYAEVLKGLRFTDLGRNQQYFGTEANPGPIFQVAKQASEIWLKAGVIRDTVNLDMLISTGFIDNGSVAQKNVKAVPLSNLKPIFSTELTAKASSPTPKNKKNQLVKPQQNQQSSLWDLFKVLWNDLYKILHYLWSELCQTIANILQLIQDNLGFSTKLGLIFSLLIYNYKTGQVGYILVWFLKFIRQPFPSIYRFLTFFLPEPILNFFTPFFVYLQNYFAIRTVKLADKESGLEINLLHKDGLQEKEGNLKDNSQVIIHILEPLESKNCDFARTIYKNISEKNICYSYIFDIGSLTKETENKEIISIQAKNILGNCVETIRNILLAFLLEDSKFKQLNQGNLSNFSEHLICDLLEGVGKDNQHLWKKIQKHLTIHIRPFQISEIFFMYIQGEEQKDCYIRWSEQSSWFIQLDRTVAEHKQKAYEYYVSRYFSDRIIDISPEWGNKNIERIKKILEETWKEKVPEHMKECFPQLVYGNNNHTISSPGNYNIIEIRYELEEDDGEK